MIQWLFPQRAHWAHWALQDRLQTYRVDAQFRKLINRTSSICIETSQPADEKYGLADIAKLHHALSILGGNMDTQSLTNVLAIMREMATGKAGQDTGRSVINRLAGNRALSDNLVLRIADHVLEQVVLATSVVENSTMRAEAKVGVLQILKGLETAFSITYLQSSWSQQVHNLPGAISSFVILLDAAGIPEPPEMPEEALDLVRDIEKVVESLKDPELDPVVRSVAEKHLVILATFLKHIPVFGLEGAMTSYLEMMTRIRRAEVNSSPAAKAKFDPVWSAMTRWSERIGAIDKVWNAGARVMNHADKAAGLLDYIPHVI